MLDAVSFAVFGNLVTAISIVFINKFIFADFEYGKDRLSSVPCRRSTNGFSSCRVKSDVLSLGGDMAGAASHAADGPVSIQTYGPAAKPAHRTHIRAVHARAEPRPETQLSGLLPGMR